MESINDHDCDLLIYNAKQLKNIEIIDVNPTQTFYDTCKNGKIDIVLALDLSVKNIDYKRAFRSACAGGNLDIVKYILDKKLNFSKYTLRGGFIIASNHNHTKITRYIYELGDANDEDFYHYTLYSTCNNGDIDLVKTMIETHKFTKDDFEFAIKEAAEGGCLEIFNMFNLDMKVDLDDSIFKSACIGGNIEIIQKFETYEFFNWETVLVLASEYGNLDLMETVIDAGIDAVDKAMIQACKSDRPECIELLIKSGADIEAGFLCACDEYSLNCVEILLRYKPKSIAEGYSIISRYDQYGLTFRLKHVLELFEPYKSFKFIDAINY